MDIKTAIKIFKDIYSIEYDETEKDNAIDIVITNWAITFQKITKADLIKVISYQQDTLGK